MNSSRMTHSMAVETSGNSHNAINTGSMTSLFRLAGLLLFGLIQSNAVHA
jgi:hypothetical protein